MTNTTKLMISVAGIVLIASMLITAFYIRGLSRQMDNVVTSYSARREELILQQQKLQAAIDDLNRTVQREAGLHSTLAQTLQNITNTVIQTPVAQASTPPPTTAQAPPAAQPSIPTRTTRAS